MQINELYVGQEYKMSRSFTQEDVRCFASLSSDYNPVHLDQEYGRNSIFKRNIVHGFLTGSLFSAIIGTKMPGEGSIYLKQDMKFTKPVHIDEEITAVVKIIAIVMEKRIIRLSTMLLKANGEVAIEGEALVKFLN